MTASVSEKLDRVMGIPYDSDFLLGLAELYSEPEVPPWPFDLFWSLSHFYDHAESGWISEYLRSEAGAEFATALVACETIGASRAAEYLRAVAKQFPHGRVPTDEDERVQIVEAVRVAKPPTKKFDALNEMGESYADAFPELVAAVRQFVSKERNTIISVLSEGQDSQHQ